MMGRMQRRKQDRNYKNKVKENENENLFTLGTFIKVVVGCFIFVLIFYFILVFFVTKEVKVFSSNNKTEDSSQNDSNSVNNKILASKIFEQEEDSYYVYFYDFSSEDEKLASAVSNVSDTVYRVNVNDGFNKNYVSDSDKGNIEARELSDLKVINPTLIKISNDSIVEYYEGVSSILSHLSK